MTRPLVILVTLVALLAAIYFWRSPKSEPGSGDLAQSAPESASSPEPADALAPVVHPKAVAENRDVKKTESLKSKTPTLEEYRESAKQDPHSVPAPIKEFAEHMGEKMEAALKSESAARELMGEFESCVEQEQVPTVQQMCLINTRRLLQQYSSLKKEADRVEDASSDALKKTVKELGF